MSKRPHVIFFYMNGCPHCEHSWPAWNKAKTSMRGVAVLEEKESKDVSPTDGVSSFPTFVVKVNDKEIKRIEGARENPKELLKELGLNRSRTSRGRTNRRKRQLTKRTLRNYKSLGK